MVSPHLDDAILSLGATIRRWTRSGERVVIATIYTTGPALAEVPASMRKWADYAARRAEDAAACAVVGAEPRFLDRVERAFRRPFLTGTQYFRTPATRAGFTGLRDVTSAIESLLELAPDRIVLPLGIGNHIDHVETMLAATDCVLERELVPRVAFYEDFYALSNTLRRQHPIAKTIGFLPWQVPLLRARRLGVMLTRIAAARRGPPLDSLLAAPWRTARWTVERSNLEADEPIKLDAIRCYASQTRALGGYAGMARALRAYHRFWGGAEPLWRATLAH